MPTLTETVPVLRMFDDAKTREFYFEFLGFRLVFEHRFEPGMPLYMGISRDGVRLHLSEHHGDCTPGSGVRFGVDDATAFADALRAKDYGAARPRAAAQPWGTIEFSVVDPAGNTLTFFEVTEPG